MAEATALIASNAIDEMQGPRFEFWWNGRTCFGTDLHKATVENDVREVTRILEQSEDKSLAVRERFHYETTFRGKRQEGSGEAVHLAASRGFIGVLQVLLSARADMGSMVTRDNKPHFDVLQAATFSEGKRGDPALVNFLLEKKASYTPNLDGRYPIHLAFQTGNAPLIHIFRSYMLEAGLCDEDLSSPGWPLEFGIRHSKMRVKELVACAETTQKSLNIFLDLCPRAVGPFLKRVADMEGVSFAQEADLSALSLSNALKASPATAILLLDAFTAQPDEKDPGYHPLPARVIFEDPSAGIWALVWRLFNPQVTQLTFYESDQIWDFDGSSREAPRWQGPLLHNNAAHLVAMLDAEFKVCHVRNLICAELFSALSEVDDGGLLALDHVVLKGAVSYFFETFVCKVELAQLLLTLWGLLLLLKQAGTQDSAVTRFLAARGFLDFCMETLQVFGFWSLGRWQAYFHFDSIMDLASAFMALYLFVDPHCKVAMVGTIFSYWARLLGCASCWGRIGPDLQPVRAVLRSLGPALLLTMVAFGAFTHVSHVLSQGDSLKSSLYGSFLLLFTSSMPDVPDEDLIHLLLTYLSVLCFSVYVLNIFIGVISEIYSSEAERCQLTFQRLRATLCLNFLSRANFISRCPIPKAVSIILMLVLIVTAVAIQVSAFNGYEFGLWEAAVYFMCQSLMIVVSFQSEDVMKVLNNSGEHGTSYFLWTVTEMAAE